jgi:prophage maintenance system killer protein
MMASVISLHQQKDQQRFLRAVDYVAKASRGIKKITSNELAQLNQMLTDSSDDPWRFDEVEIQIPSGQRHTFSLVSNPMTKARDLLGMANQRVGNSETVEAAALLYAELVLNHLFRDANRRTAVLAVLWILESGGIQIDAEKLLNIPLGDLRNKTDRDTFVQNFERLIYPNRP